MTHENQEPVIRDVASGDAGEIAELLAVRPARSKRGNDGERHHARLDRTGFPVCRTANDPGHRDHHQRYGQIGRPVVRLPVGSPLWSDWRAPMP